MTDFDNKINRLKENLIQKLNSIKSEEVTVLINDNNRSFVLVSLIQELRSGQAPYQIIAPRNQIESLKSRLKADFKNLEINGFDKLSAKILITVKSALPENLEHKPDRILQPLNGLNEDEIWQWIKLYNLPYTEEGYQEPKCSKKEKNQLMKRLRDLGYI